MQSHSSKTTKPVQIHLAFDVDTLVGLLRAGKLHASDFKCMDPHSKYGVWAMMRHVAAAQI
jgi:hypothetical protein